MPYVPGRRRSGLRFNRLTMEPVRPLSNRKKAYLWKLHVAIRNSSFSGAYLHDLKRYHGAYKAATKWFNLGWRIGRVKQEAIHTLIRPMSTSQYY